MSLTSVSPMPVVLFGFMVLHCVNTSPHQTWSNYRQVTQPVIGPLHFTVMSLHWATDVCTRVLSDYRDYSLMESYRKLFSVTFVVIIFFGYISKNVVPDLARVLKHTVQAFIKMHICLLRECFYLHKNNICFSLRLVQL